MDNEEIGIQYQQRETSKPPFPHGLGNKALFMNISLNSDKIDYLNAYDKLPLL